MSEEEIIKKQNYLRENILDKGYDPEEFLSFLIQKKGVNGGDLDQWKMEDLYIVYFFFVILQCVNEFINSHSNPNQNESENIQQNESENIQQYESENIQQNEEIKQIENKNESLPKKKK